MDIVILIKGFVIGFTIAASIGPIGILCIKRSLANGFSAGFFSGMGVATADGTYGAIAAFGLTFISSFLIQQQIWLQVFGVIFLLYLGIKIFAEKPKENAEKVKSNGFVKDYLTMFILTIVNPMTILMFTAAFASFGDTLKSESYISASILTLGVFMGSAALYIILSIIFGLFHQKLKSNLIVLVNKISASIIIGFAITISIQLIKKLILIS